MGTGFAIEQLDLHVRTKLEARGRWETQKVGSSVFRLQGPVGSGKSSAIESMWYSFGLAANLMPAVVDNVKHIRTTARINGRRFQFERPVLTTAVASVKVTDLASGQSTMMPVKASGGEQTISDFLLETMGFPQVSLPGGSQAMLSFHDIQTLTYLRQAKISNALLGHDTEKLNDARVLAMDVALGVYAPEIEQHRRQRNKVNRQLNKLKLSITAVKSFLREHRSTTEAELRGERLLCEQAIREAKRRVERAQDRVSTEEQAERVLIKNRDTAKRSVESGRAADDTIRRELTALRQSHTSKDKAVRRMSKLSTPPTHCPLCTQLLVRAHLDQQQCALCLQSTDSSLGGSTTAVAAVARLESELTAIHHSIEQAEQRHRHAHQVFYEATGNLVKAMTELEQHQLDRLRPRREELTKELEALNDANARLATLLPRMEELRALRTSERTKAELETELLELDEILRSANADLADRRAEVARHLSATFRGILQLIGVAGGDDAKIDSRDYSPVVGGHGFTRLAVAGGRKTIVNMAYHLAILDYVRRHADAPLPNFLVIDSPREGIGSRGPDRQLVERTYDYLRSLTTIEQGKLSAVQLIMADNDPAHGGKRGLAQLDLSYENPFVPGVPHPGHGNVPTVETFDGFPVQPS